MAKPRMLYILSPSYSGSTLLTFLLAQHPEIATIGELKATSMGDIKQYTCSCGEPILSCSFWQQAQAAAKAKGMDFSLDDFGTHFKSDVNLHNKILGAQVRGLGFEALRSVAIGCVPGLQQEYNAILKRNKVLVDVCLELQGGSIFIDGSKDPNRLEYLVRSNLWDIDVLYMVRDGRAQANSAREKPLENLDYESACKEWVHTIDQMDAVLRYVDTKRVMKLKYEDLCKEPNAVINSIWSFLGIEAIDQDWSDVALDGSEHHILGNDNMRKAKSVTIRHDEKWRGKVSEAELALYQEIAGPTHMRLFYN